MVHKGGTDMHKLKVGIVGLGRGKRFFHNFSKFRDLVEITAVMDIDEATVTRFKKQHDIPYAFTDYESLLNSGEIDIVVLATPFQFHAEQAILALQRDIHVLSEVTAANSMAECKALLK